MLSFTKLSEEEKGKFLREKGLHEAHLERWKAEILEGLKLKPFGGGKKDKPDEYRKRSAEFFPEKFAMPVAITAGGKDTVVPAQSVLRLAAAIKKSNPNLKLIYRENGGHATDYKDTVEALDFVIQTVLGSRH